MTNLICIDCKATFEDKWNLYKKCVHCRERDQSYQERGQREEMGYDDHAA